MYFENLSKYVAAADSRHLSVVLANWNLTWLLYEPTDGGVALLNGSLSYPMLGPNVNPVTTTWIWKESSKELQVSLPDPTVRFSAPFTISDGKHPTAFFASKFSNGSYNEEISTTSELGSVFYTG